jgi:hypothetical protein
MAKVVNQNSTLGLLRVVVDNDNIFIIQKDSAYVYAQNGLIYIGDETRVVSLTPSSITTPNGNTTDELIIQIRELIDNV